MKECLELEERGEEARDDGMSSIEDKVWEEHCRGHYGPDKIYRMMKLQGQQVTLKQCQDVVWTCLTCAKFRRVMPRSERGAPPFSETPGHTIYADFIGPILGGARGQKHVCSVIDSCTRVAHAKVSRVENAGALIRTLQEWVTLHGPFKVLVLDNASYNSGLAVIRKSQEWGFECIYPPPYRHEAMGLVERFNATIVDRTRKLALSQGRNWVDMLGRAVEAYNTTWHDVVQAVPNILWQGTEEQWRAALKNTEIKRIKGQPAQCSPQSFEPGMLVLIYDHVRASSRSDKMTPLWWGPVELERKESEHIWRYKELQPREGGGRRRVAKVHEDHIQSFEDKR